MREARIIVPTHDNDGRDLRPMLSQFKRRVVETFGGFTETPAAGGWKAPDGRIVTEPVLAFDIASDDVPALLALAEYVREAARQEAVYLRLPDGTVHFISA